jgi:hypothetical protein
MKLSSSPSDEFSITDVMRYRKILQTVALRPSRFQPVILSPEFIEGSKDRSAHLSTASG